jgi:hypothetical protein
MAQVGVAEARDIVKRLAPSVPGVNYLEPSASIILSGAVGQ